MRNPVTRKCYRGCYAADQIPPPPPHPYDRYPCCMVINTARGASPGEHWVAVFLVSERHVEYFDSLAEWPPQSPYIGHYLAQFPQIDHNGGEAVRPVQNPLRATCGAHVCYFIYARCLGQSFSSIVQRLTRLGSAADRFVCRRLRNTIFKA